MAFQGQYEEKHRARDRFRVVEAERRDPAFGLFLRLEIG
jgi:hypothetical protein